jgi:acyl-coenzyme A synthetase/AMP-(fatty) acid ligase
MPKAVPHTHSSILFLANTYLREYGSPLDPTKVPNAGTVCFTPFFHVMSYCVNLLVNLVAGARSSLLATHDATLSPSLMLQSCRALRPSVCNTVPWVVEGFAAMIQAGESHVATELARLHLLTYGGAALTEECAQSLKARGVELQCTYGQTELAGPVPYGEKGGHPSALRPLPGIEYELVSGPDDGPHEGELVLLGCGSAMLGYVALPSGGQRKALSGSARSTHERYHTNDRFTRTQLDGQKGEWLLYLCRNDDLLVHTSGEMSNPLPTEAAMLGKAMGVVSAACMLGTNRPRSLLLVELFEGVESDNKATRATLLWSRRWRRRTAVSRTTRRSSRTT